MTDTSAPYIEVGHISASHGLRGAVCIHSETRPVTAIGDYREWWLGTDSNNPTCYQVERCWMHGRKLLATFENVASRDEADRLRGLHIFIPPSAIEEEEEAFLWHRLVGCMVVTTAGETVGEVCRIEDYGSSDILIVTDPSRGGEWMIPFTASIMIDIDLDQQSITVDLPDGMDACFSPRS